MQLKPLHNKTAILILPFSLLPLRSIIFLHFPPSVAPSATTTASTTAFQCSENPQTMTNVNFYYSIFANSMHLLPRKRRNIICIYFPPLLGTLCHDNAVDCHGHGRCVIQPSGDPMCVCDQSRFTHSNGAPDAGDCAVEVCGTSGLECQHGGSCV